MAWLRWLISWFEHRRETRHERGGDAGVFRICYLRSVCCSTLNTNSVRSRSRATLSRARAPAQASMLLSGTAHYPKLVRTTHMSSHVGPTDRNPWLRCTQAQRDASSSRRCRPVPKVVPNTPSRAVIPSPPPSRPAMRRGRAECPPRPHPSWRTALGHVAAARRTQGRLPRACSPERETRR